MKPDPSKEISPTSKQEPSRLGRLMLLFVILIVPVCALLWMALGRAPKPVEALSAGEITRRSTPDQAVQYALPSAVHPITALTLSDGRELKAQANLPLDRDQIGMYIFTLLTDLVGRDAQQRYFPQEDFARRVARSAVDLPHHYLPWSFWPLLPTQGRFLTQERDGKTYIASENDQRYQSLVQLLTGLDNASILAAYVRAYPLFQKAYASLGHNYAGYYLNDSVIAAIDDMLRTPEPETPIELIAPPATRKSSSQEARPWTNWRYADPELEQLSVGQKTLLRMGAGNRSAIKAKLKELRILLTNGRASIQ